MTRSPNVSGKLVIISNIGIHYNSNKRRTYTNHLIELINILLKLKKLNHIVYYRETSAQHFRRINGLYNISSKENDNYFDQNNDNNNMILKWSTKLYPEKDKSITNLWNISLKYYNKSKKEKKKQNSLIDYYINNNNNNNNNNVKWVTDYRCVKISSKANYADINWRNMILNQILIKLDKKKSIVVVPFFNITVGRHDHHEGAQNDCTHFCNGPLIWAPVWDFIIKDYQKRFFLYD